MEFTPIHIIYEPIFDENILVPYFFTDQIHLEYRSYIGRNIKRSEKLIHPILRQCHYCEKSFAKNNEQMKKHLNVCAAKEGITY